MKNLKEHYVSLIRGGGICKCFMKNGAKINRLSLVSPRLQNTNAPEDCHKNCCGREDTASWEYSFGLGETRNGTC